MIFGCRRTGRKKLYEVLNTSMSLPENVGYSCWKNIEAIDGDWNTLRPIHYQRHAWIHSESDNGPEFMQSFFVLASRIRCETIILIEPGSPWGERIIESLTESSEMNNQRRNLWHSNRSKSCYGTMRKHYNTVRPHSALDTDLLHLKHLFPIRFQCLIVK